MKNKSRWFAAIAFGTLAALAVACGSKPGTPTPPPPPPPPPPTTLPATFNGSLTAGGSSVNSFNVSAGTISARVSSLTGAASVGVAVGTYSGSTCTPVAHIDALVSGASVQGSIVAAGSGCVKVYDATGSAASVTYSVYVSQ